jgi:RNA polymerase sigma-70 factor (ECF subfamily)
MQSASGLHATSEDELLRRAREDAGGEDGRRAAGELLQRYRTRVYAWCRRYVRDHERALDLAQDVLLQVYRYLPSFEGRAPFSAWVFVITRHACIRAMRPVAWTRDEDTEPDALAEPDADPARRHERDTEEDALHALILDHLEPHEQRALWLRCVERMPVDEITRLLGVDQASGARGLLQTARRKLRAALERRGGNGGSRS